MALRDFQTTGRSLQSARSERGMGAKIAEKAEYVGVNLINKHMYIAIFAARSRSSCIKIYLHCWLKTHAYKPEIIYEPRFDVQHRPLGYLTTKQTKESRVPLNDHF